MRELLSVCRRNLILAFLGSALPVFIGLLIDGRAGLFGAYLIGWLLGAAVWHGIARRIERSAGLSVGGAQREMLVGLIVRLLTVALILGMAVRFSEEVFYSVIAGLLISFFLILLVLLHYGRRRADGEIFRR
ncbi:hypothetical protein TAMA11512_16640 [Selenomonas sp. TAMA-11512]|uniref:hypothetical protein n=1 Tax=Selenomonas sp. TAMA-11512 TaxID=3095337 RepID=UPI003086C536|nr:hypothetical protein TAMA11512_16640 [Selenomonas sp. TAMA-11512]